MNLKYNLFFAALAALTAFQNNARAENGQYSNNRQENEAIAEGRGGERGQMNRGQYGHNDYNHNQYSHNDYNHNQYDHNDYNQYHHNENNYNSEHAVNNAELNRDLNNRSNASANEAANAYNAGAAEGAAQNTYPYDYSNPPQSSTPIIINNQ